MREIEEELRAQEQEKTHEPRVNRNRRRCLARGRYDDQPQLQFQKDSFNPNLRPDPDVAALLGEEAQRPGPNSERKAPRRPSSATHVR